MSEARQKPSGEANLECVKQADDVVAAYFAFKIFILNSRSLLSSGGGVGTKIKFKMCINCSK